jgi:hypothetical protein
VKLLVVPESPGQPALSLRLFPYVRVKSECVGFLQHRLQAQLSRELPLVDVHPGE